MSYDAGDAAALAAAILGLVDDPAARERSVAATRDRVHELAWEREADRHWQLIERLADPGLS